MVEHEAPEASGGPPISQIDESVRLRPRAAQLEWRDVECGQSQDAYRALVDHSLQGLMILQDYRILFANRAATQVTGYSLEELLSATGEQVVGFVHPEDRAVVWQRHRDRLEGKNPPSSYEFRILRKDGEVRWMEVLTGEMSYRGRLAIQVALVDVTERKEAEKALRESEERFRTFVENMADGVFCLDLEGRLVLVNQAACRNTGYDRHELLTMNASDIDAGIISRQDRTQLWHRLKPGETARIDVTHRRKDGSIYPAEVHVSRLDLQGKPVVIAVVRDIKERKRVEEALRDSQAKLQSVFDSSPDAVTVTDLQGRITECNRAMLAIHGFSSKERVVGRSAFELIAEPDRRQAADNMAITLREGTVKNVQYTMLREDGTPFPSELSAGAVRGSSGEITGFVAVMKDITKRRQAEEALRLSEERYRGIFENAVLGMYQTTPDGEILMCNPALVRMLGYDTFEEPAARDLEREGFEPKYPRLQFKERMEADGRIVGLESAWRRRDGSTLWVRENARAVRDEAGKILFYEGTIEDITERKRAEEKLLAYQQKLRLLASELSLAEERERRRIAADLHDHVSQSLVLAGMKLQALLDGPSSAQADVLRGVCGTLNETIQNVRDLTFDLSSPTLYRFGLEAALEELLDDKLKTERDLAYQFSDDGLHKPLTSDVRVLLFQSVREILINIVKHARAHKVTLDVRRDGGSIRIIVTDDGTGFDAREVLLSPGRHRGFGLFHIKERLDYIGGALEIQSQPGQGSQLTLAAPLVIEARDTREGFVC